MNPSIVLVLAFVAAAAAYVPLYDNLNVQVPDFQREDVTVSKSRTVGQIPYSSQYALNQGYGSQYPYYQGLYSQYRYPYYNQYGYGYPYYNQQRYGYPSSGLYNSYGSKYFGNYYGSLYGRQYPYYGYQSPVSSYSYGSYPYNYYQYQQIPYNYPTVY